MTSTPGGGSPMARSRSTRWALTAIHGGGLVDTPGRTGTVADDVLRWLGAEDELVAGGGCACGEGGREAERRGGRC